MREFSYDTFMKYADFKLVWKLVSSSVSGRTSIRHYEAKAPIPEKKFYREVREDPCGTKEYIFAR